MTRPSKIRILRRKASMLLPAALPLSRQTLTYTAGSSAATGRRSARLAQTSARIQHRRPLYAVPDRGQPDGPPSICTVSGLPARQQVRRSRTGCAPQGGGGLPYTESFAGVAQLAEQPSCKRASEVVRSWPTIHGRVKFGVYSANSWLAARWPGTDHAGVARCSAIELPPSTIRYCPVM